MHAGVLQGDGAQVGHRLEELEFIGLEFPDLVRIDPQHTDRLLLHHQGNDEDGFDPLRLRLRAVLEILRRLNVLEPDGPPLEHLAVEAAFFDEDRSLADVSLGQAVRGAHQQHPVPGIKEPDAARLDIHGLDDALHDLLQNLRRFQGGIDHLGHIIQRRKIIDLLSFHTFTSCLPFYLFMQRREREPTPPVS